MLDCRAGEGRGEVGAVKGRAGSRSRRRPSIPSHFARLWKVADLARTQFRLRVREAFRRVGPRHRVGRDKMQRLENYLLRCHVPAFRLIQP